jgi:hypothetical protein
MQTTINTEVTTKKQEKLARRIIRDNDLSELMSFYKKEDNLSRSGKKYTNLAKTNKRYWRGNSIISFKEEGDKTILWPVGVE